jgi:ribonuclease Z
MNSTVLIHEATMADDEGALAWQKAHSTVGQAIDIGRRYALR